MRIGIILRHADQHAGGVRNYTENLLPALFRAGGDHDFVLFYQRGHPRAFDDTFPNVTSVALPIPTRFLWDQIAVPWLARKHRIDVLFNPKFTIPLFTRAKTAFVLHGAEWFRIPKAFRWLDRTYFSRAVPHYLERTDLAISVSRTVADEAVERFGLDPNKVVPIHHGVDHTIFSPDMDPERLQSLRAKHNLPERFVLWAGQIYPPKNVSRLLQAFSRIRDQAPHHLVLAGEPRWGARRELEPLRDPALAARVHLIGWVPADEIAALLNMADAFVLPSLCEGFGLPLLEAMACGCPIVASRTGSIPEVVAGAAEFVDPYDPSDIARAIVRVLSDSEYRTALRAKGLRRAAEFQWERCAAETLDALEAIAPPEIVSARIVVLTDSFFPPTVGGQQKQLNALSRALVALGAHVSVWTRQARVYAPKQEVVDGVHVSRIPPSGDSRGSGWRALFPVLRHQFGLFVQLIRKRHAYDLALVSGFKSLPVAAAGAGWITRKPFIVRVESPHELDEPLSRESVARLGGLGRLALTIATRLQFAAAGRAAAIVAPSAEVERRLLYNGLPPQLIHRIPNGIDERIQGPIDPEAKTRLRGELGLPAEAWIYVSVGRVARSKGIPELLQAFRALAKEAPNAHLLIVGSGLDSFDDCDAEVEAARADPALSSQIHAVGESNRVFEYLQASDAFVFPSHYEGFGLALTEALGCGLPAITTRVGIADEVVTEGQNGTFVPVGNAAALTRSMQAWGPGAVPSAPEALRESAERIRKRFDLNAVANAYFKLTWTQIKRLRPES